MQMQRRVETRDRFDFALPTLPSTQWDALLVDTAEHDAPRFVSDVALTRIAGLDISFYPDSETRACASIVLLDMDNPSKVRSKLCIAFSRALSHLARTQVLLSMQREVELLVPYISGFLAFREIPIS